MLIRRYMILARNVDVQHSITRPSWRYPLYTTTHAPGQQAFFCRAGGYPLKNCSLAPPSPLKCWQLHNLSARVFYLLMMNTLETVFLAAINHPLSLFPTKSFVFHSHFLHTPSPSYQWSLKVHCVPVDGNNDDLGLGQGNSGLHLITFTLYDVFLKWGWW